MNNQALEVVAFEQAVKPFKELYDRVTAELTEFKDESIRRGDSDQQHAAWLQYLIDNFLRLYDDWPQYTGDLGAYIARFSQRNWWGRPRYPRMLRVAGFAFLHIAHDLPIVIADSLQPSISPTIDNIGNHSRDCRMPPAININKSRALFLRPAPRLLDLSASFLKDFQLSGSYSLLGLLCPRLLRRHLGRWVVALRTTAWVHGEILANAGTVLARSDLEGQIQSALDQAARETLERFSKKVIPSFESPSLFPALIAVIEVFSRSTIPNAYWLCLLIALLILLVLWDLYRFLKLRDAVEFFGMRVQLLTTRSLEKKLPVKK